MKKTFKLTHNKIKPARLVDAIKNEVKKYLKRERNRALPTGADFWDFDCRYGADAESSEVVHVKEINKCIDKAEAEQLETFYLEIIAKPATRSFIPREESESEFEDEIELEETRQD
ncbi:MAG: DUF6172 family protein [Pseudomonadota bacterium]|nr:DUF6172 family protein [Pseudomonadota bacterium]